MTAKTSDKKSDPLKQLEQLKEESYNDKLSLSYLLRKLRLVTVFLGIRKEYLWIDQELKGYDKDATYRELEKVLPEYRKCRAIFLDWRNIPISVGQKLDRLQDFPIVNPIDDLEEYTKNGMTILAGQSLDFLRERFGAPVSKAHIPAVQIISIQNAVRSRICDSADDLYIKLTQRSLDEDLSTAINEINLGQFKEILPDDIKEKGKSMSQAYLYLYVIENSLRSFIEFVAKKKLESFDRLKLSTPQKTRIRSRKQDAKRKKWLLVRGESDIFYLSFEDLASIMQNNWSLFSEYFPDQNWIVSKIGELTDIRDLIAHNSYVGEDERQLLDVYFRTIMKQIARSVSS